MKKIFKLAAIAVSVALVTSLVACSSGDDDVVDASTPEYLVAARINRAVDSIKYEQNVSDAQIKPLKDANKAMVDMLSECADCLGVYESKYLYKLFSLFENFENNEDYQYNLDDIDRAKVYLETVKTAYGEHKKYHAICVYEPAIDDALSKVRPEKVYTSESGFTHTVDSSEARQNVLDIGNPEGNTILEGKLNDRQTANMNAYIGAAEALKAALNEDDAKKLKATIDNADKAIEAFNKLENKNVNQAEIKKVVDKVDAMYDAIYDGVWVGIPSRSDYDKDKNIKF